MLGIINLLCPRPQDLNEYFVEELIVAGAEVMLRTLGAVIALDRPVPSIVVRCL